MTPTAFLIETVHGVLDDRTNPEATLLRIAREWQHIPEGRQALLDEVAPVVQILTAAFDAPQSTMALGLSRLGTVVSAIQERALPLYLHYREGRDRMEVLARLWDQARPRAPLGQVEPALDAVEPATLARWVQLQYSALVEGVTAIHSLGENTARFYLEMAGKAPLEFTDQGLLMDMGHLFADRVGVQLFLNLHGVMRVAAELLSRITTAEEPAFLWAPPWQSDLRLGNQVPRTP